MRFIESIRLFIVNALFAKEKKQFAELIKKANDSVKYVTYKPLDFCSMQFLHGVQSIISSEFILFWLNERKRQYDELIKYAPIANRDNNIGRSMAMDELLGDCIKFKTDYDTLLTQKGNIKNGDE